MTIYFQIFLKKIVNICVAYIGYKFISCDLHGFLKELIQLNVHLRLFERQFFKNL